MSERNEDPIIGGDTPFVPASEAWHAFGPDHRPLSIKIEGKEATRATHLAMCAMMIHIFREKPETDVDEQIFMRSFIAGANHDLRALGLHPLLSVDEVYHLSTHPSIVAACSRKGGDS